MSDASNFAAGFLTSILGKSDGITMVDAEVEHGLPPRLVIEVLVGPSNPERYRVVLVIEDSVRVSE